MIFRKQSKDEVISVIYPKILPVGFIAKEVPYIFWVADEAHYITDCVS